MTYKVDWALKANTYLLTNSFVSISLPIQFAGSRHLSMTNLYWCISLQGSGTYCPNSRVMCRPNIIHDFISAEMPENSFVKTDVTCRPTAFRYFCNWYRFSETAPSFMEATPSKRSPTLLWNVASWVFGVVSADWCIIVYFLWHQHLVLGGDVVRWLWLRFETRSEALYTWSRLQLLPRHPPSNPYPSPQAP